MLNNETQRGGVVEWMLGVAWEDEDKGKCVEAGLACHQWTVTAASALLRKPETTAKEVKQE